MNAMAGTATDDIVTKLLKDHQQAKQMLSRMQQGGTSKAREMFWDLTKELVRHEIAEEEVVYPEVRKTVPNGERLADARIKEQAEAEELLKKMEKAGADDKGFPANFEKLHKAVLEHAEKEERLIFEPMRTAIDAERRATLGQRYEKAKAAAPTHPHPGAPDTPPGNIVLGPVAALIDRARDAMHKAAS
jgi:hemerythrin superfamily protein